MFRVAIARTPHGSFGPVSLRSRVLLAASTVVKVKVASARTPKMYAVPRHPLLPAAAAAPTNGSAAGPAAALVVAMLRPIAMARALP